MKTYLIIGALIMLGSCSPQVRLSRVMAKNPGILAEPCARAYPVKTFDSVRIEYREGKTQYLPSPGGSTDCDSAVAVARQAAADAERRALAAGATAAEAKKAAASAYYALTHKVQIPCPPSTHRVDTFDRSRVQVQELTAKTEMFEAKINGLTAQVLAKDIEIKKAHKATGRWRLIALCALGLIGLGAIWKFVIKR